MSIPLRQRLNQFGKETERNGTQDDEKAKNDRLPADGRKKLLGAQWGKIGE